MLKVDKDPFFDENGGALPHAENVETQHQCRSSCQGDGNKGCDNQFLLGLQKEPNPTHAKVQVAPFEKGDGLFATQTTEEGTRIGQYIGALSKDRPNDFSMCFACNDAFVDGKNGGKFTRKINHSCKPNCRMETWTFEENGEVYETLVVVASKKISVGNELTISYGDDYNLGTCKCVAGCCRDLPTILLGLLEGAAEPPTLEQHPSMQVLSLIHI